MKRSSQQEEDELKKRESAPANNNSGSSGHGALAAAARDHELLQLKASLRRSDQNNNNNKSDPTTFAIPTSPTERSATTTAVSERGALWERARSHPLLQAKVALAGNGGGDNASIADSHHFSIESFVDDDLPMVEIENAPHHELLQAKVNIRSTSVTSGSHHHLDHGENNGAAAVSPVNHYRYQAATTTTSMPRDPVEWIQPNMDNYNYNSNDNNLPATNWEENEMLEEHRSSTLSLGLRSRVSSGDFAEDGDEGEDSRSQDDGTLALTATVVDEDQERQRLEQDIGPVYTRRPRRGGGFAETPSDDCGHCRMCADRHWVVGHGFDAHVASGPRESDHGADGRPGGRYGMGEHCQQCHLIGSNPRLSTTGNRRFGRGASLGVAR
jgi:hypothetical protein